MSVPDGLLALCIVTALLALRRQTRPAPQAPAPQAPVSVHAARPGRSAPKEQR